MFSGLVRWLICGLSGAAMGLLIVLPTGTLATFPAVWLFVAFGFLWALIAGAVTLRVPPPSRAWFLPVAAVIGAACNSSLPPHLLPHLSGQPWPLTPTSLNGIVTGALTGYAGALTATLLAWPSDLQARRGFAAGAVAILAGVMVLWFPTSPVFHRAVDHARQISCQSDLRMLGNALRMYAMDNDDRLPLCKVANDLPGVDYTRQAQARARGWGAKGMLGGGAIWPYMNNGGIFFCPSDEWNRDCFGRAIADRFPVPGIGYTWNASAAGKAVAALPLDTWLFHDREPWHFHGWNVAFPDGSAKWCAEIPVPHPSPPPN